MCRGRDIMTPYKTLSEGCAGKEIWDMWIVYGMTNPPWVLSWEFYLRRYIRGWCDDPRGCATNSCIIIIINIALTLLYLYCVVLPYWLAIYVIVLSSFTCTWWSCICMFPLVLLYMWYNTYFCSILVWYCIICEIY